MPDWLFASKPTEYRLLDALRSGVDELEWIVTRSGGEMRPGDRVFLWQMKGAESGDWGVHAVGELVSNVRRLANTYVDPHWTSESERRLDTPRVRVRVTERVGDGRHLRRDELDGNPILASLPHLRFHQAANFRLDQESSDLLYEWWQRIALPRGPDPTLPSIDTEDRYDESARDQLAKAARSLLSKTLEELEAMLKTRDRAAARIPSKVKVAGIPRDPVVVAITRKRAKNKCEVSECDYRLFLSSDGLPYVEVHHIHPLGSGGSDTIDNTACVCPSHHREAHFGQTHRALAVQFEQLRQRRTRS